MIDSAWVDASRKALPELPEEKRQRFVSDHGIPEYDAGVLTDSRELADYYEAVVAEHPKPKTVSNWVMGELLRELKNDGREISDCPVAPKALAELLKLVDNDTISGKIGKTVFEEMYQTGKAPEDIVKEKGLIQISDEGELGSIVKQVLEDHPDQTDQLRGGKDKVLGFLVGQVMKKHKAKPTRRWSTN